MSSDVRTPPDSKRPEQSRPPVMAMPDILAMTTNGQPAPGKKVTLPSGAVWEGGKTSGTSIITLPGDEPILVAGDSAEGITGDSVQVGSLAQAFHQILGAVPRFFANWMSSGALNRYSPDGKDVKTRTRVVRISSKATLSNPARDRHGDSDSDDEIIDETGSGSEIARRTPRFARGGRVYGEGGPREDKVLARLSPGEFVVNAAATSKALPLLAAINGGWVPSPTYLDGMLPGFADGGLVGASNSNAQSWRDLLRNPMGTTGSDGAFRPQDFGLFGLVADALGGIGNAAINAGGAAGAAIGSVIAPAFGPGGVLGTLFGSDASNNGSTTAAETRSKPADLGEPNPLDASMQVKTEGNPAALGLGRAYQAPMGSLQIRNEDRQNEGLQPEGVNQLGSLSSALAQGIVGAATEAGSRVGFALGSALAPALGPDGQLAPEIGAQLGSLIGEKFGGSLTASMTLSGQTGGPAAGGANSLVVDGSGDGGIGGDGTSYVPRSSESGGDAGGGGSTYSVGGGGGSTIVAGGSGGTQQSPANSLIVRNRKSNNGLQSGQQTDSDGNVIPVDTSLGEGASPTDGTPAASIPSAQTLELGSEIYDPKTASFKDYLNAAGGKVAGDAVSSVLTPILGDNASGLVEAGATEGAKAADWLGDLYKSVDPDGNWSAPIAAIVKKYTGVEWTPTNNTGKTPEMTDDQKNGLAALQGGISGFQQHGIVGGITGAIKGAASNIGSTLGTAAGTLVAPFLGPLGAMAPAVGSMIGSMVANTAAEFITKPIEVIASGIKEEVGSGFGLTDLAKGPGGRTMRGDIFNFNGMDPKSASIAVERVRRRRSLAQQRGGGLGR
ncbi:hypothetical protein [Nocardia sp. NPDC052566]|uniref:hypothetical protein n=1 Tax=Nocardia sp. NPDC052566 TaxID=3364330 RepID=UPI0037CBF3A1